jgi:hypothetical protein
MSFIHSFSVGSGYLNTSLHACVANTFQFWLLNSSKENILPFFFMRPPTPGVILPEIYYALMVSLINPLLWTHGLLVLTLRNTHEMLLLPSFSFSDCVHSWWQESLITVPPSWLVRAEAYIRIQLSLVGVSLPSLTWEPQTVRAYTWLI